MSCYFRHMKGIFSELGITVTADNKKGIDRLIHNTVGVPYKDCPAAWKKVKAMVRGDDPEARGLFVAKLGEELKRIKIS